MSREFSQHSIVAQDLFGCDTGGFGATLVVAATGEVESEDQPKQTETRVCRPSFSEDLWEDARRRHCESRQNWRNLLDRFVKPHHL